MDALKSGADVFFVLMGAVMVLAMHSGFAFLEVGTVRRKNQVNELIKILVDFAFSTMAYFFIGYAVAYGVRLHAAVRRRQRHSRRRRAAAVRRPPAPRCDAHPAPARDRGAGRRPRESAR